MKKAAAGSRQKLVAGGRPINRWKATIQIGDKARKKRPGSWRGISGGWGGGGCGLGAKERAKKKDVEKGKKKDPGRRKARGEQRSVARGTVGQAIKPSSQPRLKSGRERKTRQKKKHVRMMPS